MRRVLKKTMASIVWPTLLLGVSACATAGQSGIDNEGDSRRVGKVSWNNQVDSDFQRILAADVDTEEARLVFIRRNDNDVEQTSANVSINDRYQVSLHPGNYTVVNSCVGINQISAHATGFKDNNLLADKRDYLLAGGQTYFFYVDMDNSGNSKVDQITRDSALSLLEGKRYQTHQVSRVVPNCPAPTVTPPVVQPPAPVLVEKVTIELEVLFETDKAVVQPQYYSNVSELAAFMRQYPNTVVTIEGHTDSRASERYNQVLSQRRVDAVKALLITNFDIAPNRIMAIGYGELKPRASNDTKVGQQLNRRVVAIIEESISN